MVIENNNKHQEQQEIIQQETTNENNTIEHVLQKKFQDPAKESFFMKIFNDPLIKNTYQQKSLIQFIQGEKQINKFYRENQKTEHNEKVKKIVEMIDIFEQNNGNTTIINVSNILENDVANKENDVKKKGNDFEKKEIINLKIEKIKEAREATKQSYDTLAEEYKMTDEQMQEFKSKAENQPILEKVKEKLQGTNLNVDEYIRFYMTASTHQEKLQGTEFMTNYEKLSGLLEILLQKMSMKSVLTNKEQVDNITTTNPSLENYIKTSSKLNLLTIPNFPEIKDFDEEFALYVKFVPDEKLKTKIIRNKDLIKAYLTSTDEAKKEDQKSAKAYQEYVQAIQEGKERFSERTKEIIKKRVLGACITGLASYFDTTTLNQENVADMFIVDTQKGFSIIKNKRGYNEIDNVLYIKGTIKGYSVGFYYNLDNPNAQLESDDFLNLNSISNTFTFGAKMGGKKQLGIKLPTISMLTDQAQMVINKHFTNEFQKASNIEDFEKRIKEKISKELLKNYGQKMLVSSRIERDCEKNITTQTLQKIFFPEIVISKFNENTSINKITESNIWKILHIRDKTTEYMGSNELRKFKSLITKLDMFITKKSKIQNLESYRKNLLENIFQEKNTSFYTSQRGEQISYFFEVFSQNGKIFLNDIEIFVTILEKQESIDENLQKFSPNFQTLYEQFQADQLLKNI